MVMITLYVGSKRDITRTQSCHEAQFGLAVDPPSSFGKLLVACLLTGKGHTWTHWPTQI